MTVKENRTILSRATIRAIAITALVAVAAVFSTQNTGVAFGSCPYTPSPGDQADLWLDMGSEDTYFTDAEWPGYGIKTFSLKGPFRGEVNIRTYTGWGLTTSTTSSEISCTTAQSYTVTKNTESMPIYLKRCNWGGNTSLQFGITHERKCILNGTQSYIYPMLITNSDMEGTPLTYTTGGEDGRGSTSSGVGTNTQFTPATTAPQDITCEDQARETHANAPAVQSPEDGYNPPVITDLENIPEPRNQDTLNAWNKARNNAKMAEVYFYLTNDRRYLTFDEAIDEFGRPRAPEPIEPLPVPDDLETIPADRTVETLAGWNRARHAAGMTRTIFHLTDDQRLLTEAETMEQLGPRLQGETTFTWGKRLGFKWAPIPSGYGKTDAEREAEAATETTHEWQQRIGLRWDASAHDREHRTGLIENEKSAARAETRIRRLETDTKGDYERWALEQRSEHSS